MKQKFCIYARVSSKSQGDSGLSLEWQFQTCENYVVGVGGEVSGFFHDVMTGTRRSRKGLLHAVETCKSTGATLLIAKLDRLARDSEFAFSIRNSNIEIKVLDMPVMNTMIFGILASLAEYESELGSARTRAALSVAKKRGIRLGSQNEKWREKNEGTVEKWQRCGTQAIIERATHNENNIKATKYVVDAYGRIGNSWTEIAKDLNRYGFRTSRGNLFHAKTVQRIYESRERYV